jgi:hypothetical protein
VDAVLIGREPQTRHPQATCRAVFRQIDSKKKATRFYGSARP